MSDQPQPQITPEQPLSVTLSIAQWRELMERLAAPMRPVQQLLGDIERQCQTQIQRLQQPELHPRMQRGNGAVVEDRPDA